MKRFIPSLFLVMTLAACGTSPEPDYYDLTAVPGAVSADALFAVEIRRPSLAGYLDRPDIVRQNGAYQVDIDESRRWAEPLDTMTGRILAEDLQQRLPNASIFTESDTPPSDARFIIEINLQQFNAVEGNRVALKGTLIIKDKTGARQIKSQSFAFDAEGGSSAGSLAQNLSNLIGKLADRIVGVLGNGS